MPLGPLAAVAATEHNAASAVELLLGLQKAGYFRNPTAAKHLTQDGDLAPLRGRADFRQLLSDTTTEPKP